MSLPGMELLGFFDQPYQIKADPARRSQPIAPLASKQPGATRQRSAPHHTSQVSQLWETTELDSSALEWWKPQIIARRKLGTGRFRPSTAAVAGVTALLLLAVVIFMVNRSSDRAAEASATLIADARGLSAGLGELRALAESLGSPTPPDLSASTTTVLASDGAARDVFAAAGEIPESDAQLRDSAVAAAGGILEASTGINRLVAYRLAAEDALTVPQLPARPGELELPALAEQVAEWRANLGADIAALPANVMTDNRARLESWQTGLQGWQEEYLNAALEGDQEGMATAVTGLGDEISELHGRLLTSLTDAGMEVASGISDAEDAIAALLAG